MRIVAAGRSAAIRARPPRALPARAPTPLDQEPGPEAGRARTVDPARPRRQGQAGRHHHVAVAEDAPGYHRRRGHDRQHRHPGRHVVLAESDRQRPEVRRGPEEDHREEDHGWPGHGPGHGGPADQHGEASRRAADDDVRRGPPFQAERVDEYVEQDRSGGQGRRHPVDGQPEQRRGGNPEHCARGERLSGPDRGRPADQCPVGGPPHHRVDVAVEVAVDRVRAPGGQRTSGQRDRDQQRRRQAAAGQQHRRERGDQQQFDDPGLGQSEQGPDDQGRWPPRWDRGRLKRGRRRGRLRRRAHRCPPRRHLSRHLSRARGRPLRRPRGRPRSQASLHAQ